LRGVPDLSAMRARFDELHQTHYGHSAPKEPVMMVNLRLSALGKSESRLSMIESWRESDCGQRGTRPVIFDLKPIETPIFLRSGFKGGGYLDGPAVIEDIGATILLYPGDTMQVNEHGHLVIEVETAAV